jgi:hypothetical protein
MQCGNWSPPFSLVGRSGESSTKNHRSSTFCRITSRAGKALSAEVFLLEKIGSGNHNFNYFAPGWPAVSIQNSIMGKVRELLSGVGELKAVWNHGDFLYLPSVFQSTRLVPHFQPVLQTGRSTRWRGSWFSIFHPFYTTRDVRGRYLSQSVAEQ